MNFLHPLSVSNLHVSTYIAYPCHETPNNIVHTYHKNVQVRKRTQSLVVRDSSVGIAIRYELDGPGIESSWMRGFPHPSRQTLESSQPPIQRVSGLFPGDKVARKWR
jgi:hypothetical protein